MLYAFFQIRYDIIKLVRVPDIRPKITNYGQNIPHTLYFHQPDSCLNTFIISNAGVESGQDSEYVHFHPGTRDTPEIGT